MRTFPLEAIKLITGDDSAPPSHTVASNDGSSRFIIRDGSKRDGAREGSRARENQSESEIWNRLVRRDGEEAVMVSDEGSVLESV